MLMVILMLLQQQTLGPYSDSSVSQARDQQHSPVMSHEQQ
jgi:hypothetical protein